MRSWEMSSFSRKLSWCLPQQCFNYGSILAPGFFMWLWVLNPGTCVCGERLLLMESSPQTCCWVVGLIALCILAFIRYIFANIFSKSMLIPLFWYICTCTSIYIWTFTICFLLLGCACFIPETGDKPRSWSWRNVCLMLILILKMRVWKNDLAIKNI